ncbi:hypothetical protein LOD99_6617 [Oopsacas minuta]|uniref:Uncharacterized protein n=1 Tax=Oopsacas minuta TaxID=111878 RepID=A0AAV7JLP7_9METZ|nr:hypothetical protein LOD99_6617 [Oopsacas minuta]
MWYFLSLTFLMCFIVATYQSCEYEVIWQPDFCVFKDSLNSRILPPNNDLCNIRQSSIIRLIQKPPAIIDVLYSVSTEEDMRNCNFMNPTSSMALSQASQFQLSTGVYSFGRSYYFISPVNNTCLQFGFYMIAQAASDTCELQQICAQSVLNDSTQENLGCNTDATTEPTNTSTFTTTTSTFTTTTTTFTTFKATATNSTTLTTHVLPNHQLNITMTILIVVGAVLLILVVITSVLIIFAGMYSYVISKRKISKKGNLVENGLQKIPKEKQKIISNKKPINKEDISVIVRGEKPHLNSLRVKWVPIEIFNNGETKLSNTLRALVEARQRDKQYSNDPNVEISSL